MLGIVLVAALGGVAVATFWARAFPKDAELLSVFRQHRASFDQLRQMAIDDKEIEGYFSESELKPALSAERQRSYRALLSDIHPGLAVTVDYDDTVRFIFAVRGVAIGPSSVKGLEYVVTHLERHGIVQQNLDHASTLPAGVYLRQIEPNWFILYQRTDD